MIRRFGSPPESGRVYTLRHGAYAILPLGDQVLLTHQSQPYPEFQLPGGGIEPGESPLHALHREVIEETGWTIAAPRRLGAFRRFTFMPDYDIWAEKLCTIYVARPIRRLHDPTEPGHSAIWMPFALAVDALGNPGDQHFLAQF
ncbi:RNA pyrophosphohydrolase [Thalassovita gelatinovora]|uniref:RNA pyrophosphohydrolase n=1 Tax=Thalassovita gelatinovora TaxID=53501 RepID=A0A0P1FA79_THAGE|nr:NUDIX hydrolase [Thalassovita gelatinovora]QIZ81074.1 NUDIX hydrolase [Thalassovita gelatinovora]CUH64947.1 RNA pyrophosphohydrolase [Thalassovita gelatinovora]SEP89042.1 8-oxo-dGTP diphosphatase [Thalassovita gelatinovora]